MVGNALIDSELKPFLTVAFCHLQPTNHMNSSLTSLYRKGNPDSGTCSPRRDQPAASNPVSTATSTPSAGTLVSTGGWFIDRGAGPEKSIFIDLCDEEPTNTATNVRTCGEHLIIWLFDWHLLCTVSLAGVAQIMQQHSCIFITSRQMCPCWSLRNLTESLKKGQRAQLKQRSLAPWSRKVPHCLV